MVARFVQQHGVGTHQQNGGERHAHFPAARQGACVAVHHLLTEAEAREHFSRAAFQRIAVEFLEAVLHFAVTLDDRVHLVCAVRFRRAARPGSPMAASSSLSSAATSLTGPAPSITSATALRPAISPTSWLK